MRDTMSTQDGSTATTATATSLAPRDRFGNRIVGEPGRFGQYRVVSARNGGVARVCGEAETTKHLPYWEYDTDERRFVCRVCFPTTQPMTREDNEGA